MSRTPEASFGTADLRWKKTPPAVVSVTAAIDCWPDTLRLFGNAQDKPRERSKRTLQLKLYQALELIFSWLWSWVFWPLFWSWFSFPNCIRMFCTFANPFISGVPLHVSRHSRFTRRLYINRLRRQKSIKIRISYYVLRPSSLLHRFSSLVPIAPSDGLLTLRLVCL